MKKLIVKSNRASFPPDADGNRRRKLNPLPKEKYKQNRWNDMEEEIYFPKINFRKK